MLTIIADRLTQKTWLRHVFFLSAAVIAIVLSGYHFGTFDQVFHIPYLRKYVDPSLYPGDPFLELRHIHYSYFWFAFEPFLRLGILEPVMFIVHVATTYFTFWMFWDLSDTLFKNPLSNLIVTSAVIFPHMGLPGFQIIEFSLLNRTFVLPFLLLSINLYLNQRIYLAYFLLGLMYNLHVLSVNFVMAMVVFDSLLRIRERSVKNVLISLGLFLIGALPVLAWRADRAPIDFGLRPEMISIAARGLLYNVYYLISPVLTVLFNLMNGIATLAFFIIGLRGSRSPHNRTMVNFVYAIGIVLIVQLITTYLLPITIILQMQILRIGVFLLFFGYFYFADYLARQYQTQSAQRGTLHVLTFSFITFVSPMLPLLFWVGRNWLDQFRSRQVAIGAITGVVQVGALITAMLLHIWSPGIFIYAPKTDWVDAQNWARENTPKDAKFITPPQIFWHYIPDWRVFSERSTVVSLPELMEVPFSPDYLYSWQPRFESLAPGSIQQFNGDFNNSIRATSEAFYHLTTSDLLRAATLYKASYLVVEKPHNLDLPVAYENNGFVIYDLRTLVSLP